MAMLQTEGVTTEFGFVIAYCSAKYSAYIGLLVPGRELRHDVEVAVVMAAPASSVFSIDHY